MQAARTFLHKPPGNSIKGRQMPQILRHGQEDGDRVGSRTVDQCLQLHGGYRCRTMASKLVRDLRVHQILEGTNEIVMRVVARDMCGYEAVSAFGYVGPTDARALPPRSPKIFNAKERRVGGMR
jgi:hypothetical protein